MEIPSPQPGAAGVDFLDGFEERRETTRRIYATIWRTNLAFISPVVIVLALIPWWGTRHAAAVLAGVFAWRTWKMLRHAAVLDAKLVESLKRVQVAHANQSEVRKQSEARMIDLHAAEEDYNKSYADYRVVQDRLRVMWGGKANEMALMAAMREGLHALSCCADEPDVPTRLRKRAEALRQATRSLEIKAGLR